MAANLLEGHHATPDYESVPTVVFTLPPLAAAGLREDEAGANGLSFVSHRQDTLFREVLWAYPTHGSDTPYMM